MIPALTSGTSGITDSDAPEGEPGVQTKIITNRTVMHWAQIQAMRNKGVLLRVEDYAGVVTDNWRGLPWVISDQLVNTESTLT